MITEMQIRNDYASVFEASQLLKVNESRICQIINEGRFPGSFKFADTWLIPRIAVKSYTRLKPGKKKKEPIKQESSGLTEEERIARLLPLIQSPEFVDE